MAIYEMRTFSDLVRMVREEVGVSSTDTNVINRIKADLNLVYQEITAEKNWWWLEGHTSVQLPAYISAGTVAVTQGSAAITFTSAPAMSQNGKLFAVDGNNEVYTIESHTAGATTAKLAELYTGSSASAASYKLFTDRIPLPVDLKETTEIWHNHQSFPLEARGRQDMRKIVSGAPFAEGKPAFYYTGDFLDPSPLSSIASLPATESRSSAGIVKTIKFAASLPSAVTTAFSAGAPLRWNIKAAGHPYYNGDIVVSSISTTTNANDTITYTGKGELQETNTADTGMTIKQIDQEADYDRYRELYLYPYLSTSRVTIRVDYVKEIFPLENDSDEPAIPRPDRSVLLYGALYRAFSRKGDEAAATRNFQLYKAKLAQMAGKIQDGQDNPVLQPSKIYLGQKRNNTRRLKLNDSYLGVGGSSSGGAHEVTGTANMAAQFGTDGILTASSTVSTTELGYLDGVTSNVQTQLDAITTLADGKIYMGNGSNVATEVTPSGDVTMSNTGVNAIAAGVIVDADISASAAITRSKTASGTAYRILANDASGVMSENAALTASQAVVSDSNGQLSTTASLPVGPQTVALSDNQSSAANVLTWTVASYDTVKLDYSIKRGSAILEVGTIYLASDGTNASISTAGTTVGASGVTLTADVSAGSLRLRYTSTSTGTAPSFKYVETKWLS